MQRLIKIISVCLAAGLAMVILTACPTSQPSSQTQENEVRQSNYDRLVGKQPSLPMDYSPTRATKNFWIETWDEPGKLSYVYLMNANGDLLGYYVLEGLPVSYCTSLVVPYQIYNDSSGGNLMLPGPSVDGTYNSGGDCTTKYGKDASTGAYVEFTVGLGINALLYDQPLARQDVEPLGPTRIEGMG